MAELLDIFLAAKGEIENPERWTKAHVIPLTYYAETFSLTGALARAHAKVGIEIPWSTVLESVRARLPYGETIFDFNDHETTTHEDVLRVLDGLIWQEQRRET